MEIKKFPVGFIFLCCTWTALNFRIWKLIVNFGSVFHICWAYFCFAFFFGCIFFNYVLLAFDKYFIWRITSTPQHTPAQWIKQKRKKRTTNFPCFIQVRMAPTTIKTASLATNKHKLCHLLRWYFTLNQLD